MPEIHEGGCLCGTVRYRTHGNPDETEGTGVCHCTFCHRRTGSAFGVNAYFPAPAVEILSGELKTYEYRSDLSHQWLRMEFCPNCGTTVTWVGEWNPALRAIAVGTFDDPNWLRPGWQIFVRSALPWIVHPPGVDSYDSNPYVNVGEEPKRY
jgi:hypothetical protein